MGRWLRGDFAKWLGVAVLATAASASASTRIDHAQFRRILAGFLSPTHSPADIARLVFFPKVQLTTAPQGARSADDFFARVTANVRQLDPTMLYQRGLQVPLQPVAPSTLVNMLRSPGRGVLDRLTIVVVPGVLGEFIGTRAFEDVLALPRSSFRSHFQQRLAAFERRAQTDARYRAVLSDPQYALEHLRAVDTPLQDLVSVSSLDDVNGVPLVNLVVFNTKQMSLESLGDIGDKAQIFSRRLTKFFQVTGTPKHIAFIGYSRGTMVGLDMLAKAYANPAQNPWFHSTRALISLGGVVYGSDLADEAVNARGANPAPIVYTRLQLLQRHADELMEIPTGASFLQKGKILAHNLASRVRFIAGIGKSLFARNGGELYGWKHAWQTIKGVVQGIRAIDLHDPVSVVKNVLEGALHLQVPSAEYNLNIRKAKVLVRELVLAVGQLASRARLDWWRSNIVPTQGIRYYALAGTMTDADPRNPISQQLAGSPVSFNAKLLDYALTLNSYRDYKNASGVLINDSQVAAHRVRFWPEASQLLNPRQPTLDATFLGVVGADHWGLALRVVNQADKRDQLNPFPRIGLLQALATTVLIDEQLRARGAAGR